MRRFTVIASIALAATTAFAQIGAWVIGLDESPYVNKSSMVAKLASTDDPDLFLLIRTTVVNETWPKNENVAALSITFADGRQGRKIRNDIPHSPEDTDKCRPMGRCNNGADLTIAFDGGKSAIERWQFNPNSGDREVYAPTAGSQYQNSYTAAQFLNAMKKAKTLVIRFTEANGAGGTATFQLAGADKAVVGLCKGALPCRFIE